MVTVVQFKINKKYSVPENQSVFHPSLLFSCKNASRVVRKIGGNEIVNTIKHRRWDKDAGRLQPPSQANVIAF